MFRYFGSKATSANAVADLALFGFEGTVTLADAFGGLGNIGVEFKKRGHIVTTCDLLTFPHTFQHARIVCQRRPAFKKLKAALGISSDRQLLEVLNEPDQPSLWFVYEYSVKRFFFTQRNAHRISSAWSKIRLWNQNDWISDNERKFLVASLLNSVDAVANTAGTYYAYLKNWGRKPLKDFIFKWLEIAKGPVAGATLQGDALDCLRDKTFDILYLDPPYNARDYSRYYHLPETLARLEEIEIDEKSKSGLPLSRSKEGESIRSAMKLPYIAELIESVSWQRLVVQYAEGAYVSLKELEMRLSKYGAVRKHEVQVIGYQVKNGTRKQAHHVFLVDA